jgi:hypothetical protein
VNEDEGGDWWAGIGGLFFYTYELDSKLTGLKFRALEWSASFSGAADAEVIFRTITWINRNYIAPQHKSQASLQHLRTFSPLQQHIHINHG